MLAWIFQYSGRIFCHSKVPYDYSEIKKILVNKSDRLGDAVVTLPLLLELSKAYDITVLTSDRNDDFLRCFFKTKKMIAEPRPFLDVLDMIRKKIFKGTRLRAAKIPEYDLYLDLNGIKELDIFLSIWENGLCRRHVSFNMGMWNFFLDYTHPHYPVLFAHQHILESYRELVLHSLGHDLKMADYCDLRAYSKCPCELPEGNFIIVNVTGYERYRGPDLQFYAQLIQKCSKDVCCVILDEPGRPHLKVLKQMLDVDFNIYWPEQDFSTEELLGLAMRSQCYIGADVGISHLLQSQTNAVLFFGNQKSVVWRPYSHLPYLTQTLPGDFVMAKTVTSAGFSKIVISRKTFCVQCFDIGCARPSCVEGFTGVSDLIQTEILQLIKDCGGH